MTDHTPAWATPAFPSGYTINYRERDGSNVEHVWVAGLNCPYCDQEVPVAEAAAQAWWLRGASASVADPLCSRCLAMFAPDLLEGRDA